MTVNVVMRRRTTRLFALLSLALLTLLVRLAYIQFARGSELQREALENRVRTVTLQPKRGLILDRQGRELAISISTPSVVAYPPEVNNSGRAPEIANQLAAILGLPEDKILGLITAKRSNAWIKRKITFEQGEQIKKLRLPGITVVDEAQRYYPNGRLASQVLGFAGIDNQGLGGLEVALENELRGRPGKLVVEVDGVGREIPQAVHDYQPPADGNTVVLTIDQTIQFIAERELDSLMQSPTNPKHASVLVMDVPSGEILAMASRPDFDPNRYGDFPAENRANFNTSFTYEPGSVFKVVTISAALEEGVVKKEERFYDPGYIMVGKERIRCWKSGGHGSQTFAEGVQNSCNPVFVDVGLRLDQKAPGTFYRYIRNFGFGQRTGIEGWDEMGLLIPQQKLKQINLATISIGQGISVTPLQLVTAASAVANGGKLMHPHLVREVRSPGGQVLRRVEPEVVRQVISPETARQVGELLEGVVSGGTGSNAYIEGYRVGGKTGTAQKAGPGGYQQGRYVASFLGYAPVNQPRLAVLVLIDEPQGVYYGGQIAAPVFQGVMRDSLRYLNIPLQYDPSVKKKETPLEAPVVVPELRGLAPGRAEEALHALDLEPKWDGLPAPVQQQTPQGGARVSRGTTVLLRGGIGLPANDVEVPDLTGNRVPEAAALLEALGLTLSPQGSGQVMEQQPVPGTRVRRGTSVKVILGEPQAQETMGP